MKGIYQHGFERLSACIIFSSVCSQTVLYSPSLDNESIDVKQTLGTSQVESPQKKKRVTLLNYFQDYLKSGQLESKGLPKVAKLNNNNSEYYSEMVYVKKWTSAKHAIIFLLSNHSVQLNFSDHTKVVVSPLAETIMYVSKKAQRTICSLKELNNPSNELLHRLKYVTDCIELHLLPNNALFRPY